MYSETYKCYQIIDKIIVLGGKILKKYFDKLKYVLARLMCRKPSAIKNSSIHKTSKVINGAQIVNSNIDRYTYISSSNIICTKIGSFCSIAGGTTIGGGRHPIDWVSTSPVFYKGRNILKTNFSDRSFEEYANTIIGNDVWIGSKCLIKGGVTIGDGVIIGMGSVVTHDVPPYEVWAGNPAKFIKKRFDDETIEKLLSCKWWELSDGELKLCGNKFSKTEELIAYFEETKQ